MILDESKKGIDIFYTSKKTINKLININPQQSARMMPKEFGEKHINTYMEVISKLIL